MLAGTRRPTRARLRNMNFVDLFEFFCSMGSKNAGKSRRKSRSDHHVNLSLTRLRIKGEECFDVDHVIGRTDDMNSLTNKALREMCLRSCWTSEHNNIDVEPIIKRTAIDARSLAEALRDNLDAVSPFITEYDVVIVSGHKLSSKTRTNRANTKDPDPRHVSRDQGQRARASRPIGVERHPIRGAERRRRQAPPCRWQSWPVGTFSSWG